MKLDLFDDNIWENCPKQNVPWAKYMGLEPTYHRDKETGEEYVRLKCIDDPDGIHTAGLQTKVPIGEGYIEVKARFNNGDSGWPAIWLFNGRDGKYYEIDICEHFNNKRKVKTGLFMYKHMHSWFKRLFRPKTNTPISKTDWNIYGCQWDEKYIKVYINDECVLKYKNNGDWKAFPQTEEDRKFTLILSMQYGYGKMNAAQLPLWMDVAYVEKYDSIYDAIITKAAKQIEKAWL